MDVARSSKVKTFLAGPPCRSVSVLRLREDGGPRQVRDRAGPGMWGKSDLKPHERTLVDTDTQLLLRTLALAERCESANPGETEFMVETPEDPATYREGENIPTFTVWPEVVQVLEKDLKLKRISVDQGALGHARKKPTCLWSSIPEVVQLDTTIAGVKESGCMGWGLKADSGRLLAESKGWGPTQGENRSGGHQLGMVSAHLERACATSKRLSRVPPWCWERSPTAPTAVSKCLHDGSGRGWTFCTWV